MNAHQAVPLRRTLPLPAFVMHPFTLLVLAGVHVYLAFVHLAQLAAGNIEWTHFWKGFGALAGAYVFLALASRARRRTIRAGRLGTSVPDAAAFIQVD
jgi:hypothetical protein